VPRLCGDFEYQAASWHKPRRVIAKAKWHTTELLPHVGLVATNLSSAGGYIIKAIRTVKVWCAIAVRGT